MKVRAQHKMLKKIRSLHYLDNILSSNSPPSHNLEKRKDQTELIGFLTSRSLKEQYMITGPELTGRALYSQAYSHLVMS